MRPIAALYIDPKRGPYANRPMVDAWGIERNAKAWPGGVPVVSHPPCGPWGRMRWRCTKQDPECGPIGVAQVLKWGGILEHPANSLLWKECGLPKPLTKEGQLPVLAGRVWTLEVDQCRWGHKCQKRTWLLIVDIRPENLGPIPAWRQPTHVIDDRGRGDAARKGLKHLPKTQRHTTPPLFADWLVDGVRMVGR